MDITSAKSELLFTVNVGDSGLDTRQRMYLISWFVMQGTMGSCGNVPLQRTGLLERRAQLRVCIIAIFFVIVSKPII